MGVRQWVYGLWVYYRRYTHSAIHTAAAAALAIFGLLVFIDPRFAGVAIAAYVCPPVVLYLLGVETGREASPAEPASHRTEDGRTPKAMFETHSTDSDGDTDTDTDSDTDSDSNGSDTDSDSPDTDTDTDADTDSDSEDDTPIGS